MTTDSLLADLRRDEGLRLEAYPDPLTGGELKASTALGAVISCIHGNSHRYQRPPIWSPNSERLVGNAGQAQNLLGVSLRLRERGDSPARRSAARAHKELRMPGAGGSGTGAHQPRRHAQRPNSRVPGVAEYARALRQSEQQELRGLRRPRHFGSARVARQLRGIPCPHWQEAKSRSFTWAHRQRSRLRARQRPLGDVAAAGEQQALAKGAA